ncbi:hypothetical protein PVAND_012503 [Polypedilum vanderplanki]|uniref:Uncharacterized protein n=1 Tax=Polypedilum vanderplanki TaxID=319348 RepID=A0A9J6CMX5_POLVA|nr:hypothetical protein PVAND_012503 [Polypedilum vanderplanki]
MDSNLTERERFKIYLFNKFERFLNDEDVMQHFKKSPDKNQILTLSRKVLSSDEPINKPMTFFKHLEEVLSDLKKLYESLENAESILVDSDSDDDDEDKISKEEKCNEAIKKVLQNEITSANPSINNKNMPLQSSPPIIGQFSNQFLPLGSTNPNLPIYQPILFHRPPPPVINMTQPIYNPMQMMTAFMVPIQCQHQQQIWNYQQNMQSNFTTSFVQPSALREPYFNINVCNSQINQSLSKNYGNRENGNRKKNKPSRWDNSNGDKIENTQNNINNENLRSILKPDDRASNRKKAKKSVSFAEKELKNHSNAVLTNKSNSNLQNNTRKENLKKKLSLEEYRQQYVMNASSNQKLAIVNVSSQYKISNRRDTDDSNRDANNNRKIVLPITEVKQEPIEGEAINVQMIKKEKIYHDNMNEEVRNATTDVDSMDGVMQDIIIKECEEIVENKQTSTKMICDNTLNNESISQPALKQAYVDKLQKFDFTKKQKEPIFPYIPPKKVLNVEKKKKNAKK